MQSARARWAAEYRAGRSSYRFFDQFRDRFVVNGELELPSFFPLSFDPTRHHGDMLRWVGGNLFARDVDCHYALLNCLRHNRANYPARLPS